MSEHTMKNHQEPIDLCFGMMNCDEKGNIGIPPKYSYKISFQGKDCMVIPLEGVKLKSKPKSERNTPTRKATIKKENDDMQH